MLGDDRRVAELLGRSPSGAFEVVVRGPDGDPVVIANAPLLDDGTPMPTRYWLVGPRQVAGVSRLEAAGGVRRAEHDVDADQLARAHERYAAEREALLPAGHDGPRPTGGVGGTRTGVKCLHAHYAWHLAGGDDPVGRWVAERLAGGSVREAGEAMRIDLDTTTLTVGLPDGRRTELDVGVRTLADELAGADPARPEQLTNALGEVTDRFEEVLLRWPDIATTDGSDVEIGGDPARAIARVEVGSDDVQFPFTLGRDAAEDVFRTVATERRADRAHNPGLGAGEVDEIVPACCIVVAVMRRLDLDEVTVA